MLRRTAFSNAWRVKENPAFLAIWTTSAAVSLPPFSTALRTRALMLRIFLSFRKELQRVGLLGHVALLFASGLEKKDRCAVHCALDQQITTRVGGMTGHSMHRDHLLTSWNLQRRSGTEREGDPQPRGQALRGDDAMAHAHSFGNTDTKSSWLESMKFG